MFVPKNLNASEDPLSMTPVRMRQMTYFIFGLASLLSSTLYGYSSKNKHLPRSTALGKHFGIALPHLNNRVPVHVVFYLTTMSSVPVDVRVTTKFETTIPRSIGRVYLKRLDVKTLELETTFYPKEYRLYGRSLSFDGDGEFTLTVLIMVEKLSFHTYIAAPMAAWGREYLVITYSNLPSVILVNGERPNAMKVYLRVSAGGTPFVHTTVHSQGNVTHGNGDVIHFVLMRWDSYYLNKCDVNSMDYGSLTGTRLTGNVIFGVITGSCLNDLSEQSCVTCQNQNFVSDGDVISEMLLPEETYGTQFTTLSINYQSAGRLYAIAAHNNTMVRWATDNIGAFSTVGPLNQSDHILIPLTPPFIVTTLESSKGILAIFINCAVCETTDPSDAIRPSLFQLLPDNLFYDLYVWATPHINESSELIQFVNRMAIIIKVYDALQVYLDGDTLPNEQWVPVMGKSDWELGEFNVGHGVHYTVGNPGVYFGCYIFGRHASGMGYVHMAGFMSVPLSKPEMCKGSLTVPGDLVDNDCDGKVDEEKDDKFDNDNDNQIDEDLARPAMIHGGLTAWSLWTCSPNCSDKRARGSRTCTNPTPMYYGKGCTKDLDRTFPTVCIKCLANCPVKTWGLQCWYTCEKCGDCDKYNGSCTQCELGFKLQNLSCQACGPFEYGENCQGNCSEKCNGRDCFERIHGDCEGEFELGACIQGDCEGSNNFIYFALAAVLVVTAIVAFVICKKKKKKPAAPPESSFSSSSYSSDFDDDDLFDARAAGGIPLQERDPNVTYIYQPDENLENLDPFRHDNVQPF